MQELLKEHSQMVTALAKPGHKIFATLTPGDCHLLHMLIGMVGELAELEQALFAYDVENITEEFGDYEFYVEGYRQAFSIIPLPLVVEELPEKHDIEDQPGGKYWFELYAATTELVDATKRISIYNKPEYLADPVGILTPIFNKIYRALFNLYGITGINREDVLNHNLNKLLKGDRARYKQGTYSDDQANARADKQEVQCPY